MPVPYDPRLAGPPSRYSPALGNNALQRFEGLVKLRLGHATFGSMLLPELIFVKLGCWRFYQPSFFGPPILGFDIEPGLHVSHFSVDVGSSRETDFTRLIVKIRSDGLVRRYDDGAQLYRCVIEGPSRLLRYSSGRCSVRGDDDFDVLLSHAHRRELLPRRLHLQSQDRHLRLPGREHLGHPRHGRRRQRDPLPGQQVRLRPMRPEASVLSQGAGPEGRTLGP